MTTISSWPTVLLQIEYKSANLDSIRVQLIVDTINGISAELPKLEEHLKIPAMEYYMQLISLLMANGINIKSDT